jgi:LacI family kdg operon repressor
LLKRLRGDDGAVRTLDFPARLIVRGSTLGVLR